jgi:hypothetical protein
MRPALWIDVVRIGFAVVFFGIGVARFRYD